jgi:hypothetical protein
MKIGSTLFSLCGALGLMLAGSSSRAEEQHAVMTVLSDTTLSGYVDTSAIWTPGSLTPTAVPAEAILFQDNFETDTSANWNVFEGSGDATPDFSVLWAFDYSTNRYTSNGVAFNIPPAPNSSGTSHGVRLAVNKDDTAAVAAVSIYPKDQYFSNNFALRFDMWVSYNGGEYGGTGSTEFGTFGIHHAGTDVTWAAPTGAQAASDGVWFAVTGEAGAARDYRAYEGDPAGTSLEFTGTSGGFIDRDNSGTPEQEVVDVDADGPNYPLNLLFPRPPFETTGVPGKRWVQMEVRQSNGTITWLMDGYVISERLNQSLWSAGNIMLGTMDIFASIAAPKEDNFVIFDNVRVVDLGAEPVAPARLTLEATTPAAAEPSTHGSFTITRTGDTSLPITVNLRVRGDATSGQDYETIPTSTNMAAGVTSIVIPVTVINDLRGEPVEAVRLDLVSNIGQYEVFAPMTGLVEISDDGDITAVNLTAADAHAYEGIPSDTAAFRFTRVGDTTGSLTVNFTLSGTAVAGTDFSNIGTSVVIPDGEESAVITITPVNDTVIEEAETVILDLAAGTGYASGTQTNATATIRNDDLEPGTLIYSDNFETDTSAQWVVNEAHPGLNQVTFNWDYSTLGVPAAPDATNGTTLGLRLKANTGDVGTFTGVSVSPLDFGVSTNEDYRLSFEMWINYNGPLLGGGSGSTYMFTAGGGTTGTGAQFPGTSVEGVLFAVTGDGGAAQDYRAYASTAQLDPTTGVFAAGTQTGARNNSDAYYAPFGGVAAPQAQLDLFPEQAGTTLVGSAGFAWHDVVIEKVGTNFSWFIDNLRIATIPLTNKEISTNIFVGYFDTAMGKSGNDELNFGLVDNLRVERLSTVLPPGEIVVSAVTQSGNNLQLTFTAPDAMQTFALESSATVDGDYTSEANVQFETVSSGGGLTTRRATVPMTTPNRFFLVRQQ